MDRRSDMPHEKSYAGMTYEECMRYFADTITRICILHCGNEEDAKDCFQNVFIKLYVNEVQFESKEHIKAWLIRVAVNECTDCYRQSWKQKMTLSDDVAVYAEAAAGHAGIGDADGDYNVMELLLKLPLKYRQILYLFYYEDLKISEIAQELSTSESTIKTRLVRGRKKLEQLMKNEERFQSFQEIHVV